MKLNKFVPITLLAGTLMLASCGSKEPSESSENNSDTDISDITSDKGGSGSSDTTPVEPVYTITEAEFSALKSKLSNPKIFLEGNFTVDLSAGVFSSKNKLANGKVDCYIQTEHFMFDFDVDSYNATTQKANGDTYYYDDSDGTWSKETGEIDVAKYASLCFQFEDVFYYAPSFESFTYDEETRQYSGSKTIDDQTVVTNFKVKDGQFLSYGVVGFVTYTFSDYGTTTVTLPTVA